MSTYLELAKFAQSSFEDRRRYEWRISFSLWLAIGSVGYWFSQSTISGFTSEFYVVLILSIAAAGFHYWSHHLIARAHAIDKAQKHYWLDLCDSTGASTSASLSAIIQHAKSTSISPSQRSWILIQVFFTVLLALAVLLFVAFRVPESSPTTVDVADMDMASVNWSMPLLQDRLETYQGTWTWSVEYHGVYSTATVTCTDADNGNIIGQVFLERAGRDTIRKVILPQPGDRASK